MTILSWVVVGLITGCFTGAVVKGRGFSVIGDIIVGIVGGSLGGWISVI